MPVWTWEEGGLLRVRRGHGDVEGLVERQVEAVEASAKRCERVVSTCQPRPEMRTGWGDKRDRVVRGGHGLSGSEPRNSRAPRHGM